MKLYEYGPSRSARCHWAMKELDIKFESVHVDLHNGGGQDPSYKKIQPLGKVPALVDGDLTLYESTAILTYLADSKPDKKLIPPHQTKERALYEQWVSYCLSELDALLWTVAKNKFIYSEELRSTDVFKGCEWEIQRNFQVVEDHLKENDYILGDHFGVIDILVGQTVLWAIKQNDSFTQTFPKLGSYLEKLQDRPHFPRELYNA